MSNNFRKTGGHFWSKAGHDSNAGTTPDSPKKSITVAIAGTGNLIVGAGVYNAPSGTILTGGANNLQRVADGGVIIDFNNRSDTGGMPNQNIMPFSGFTLKNHTNAMTHRSNFSRCLLQNFNVTNVSDGQQLSLTYCKVINSSMLPAPGLWNISSSIIIGSDLKQVNAANYTNNSYLDMASSLVLPQYTIVAQILTFRNNNIQGILILGGLKYAIKDQLTGSPQDNGYAPDVFWLTEANLTANGYTGIITGWNAAVATCINRDPRFNDASKLDFTLKADSPHIGRASDGVSNIGGTAYAQSFYSGASNPNLLLLQPSVNIDTSNNNDWKLQPGEIEGTIRAIVKVANTAEVITKLPYIGNKSFNSDDVGGSSTNFNVPDSKPVTSAYPDYRTTTGVASDLLRVVIAGHGYAAGVWLKVDGQYREVTSVTADELIFNVAVRGIVGAGTPVQVGTLSALTSLNPNRLNYLMRSSLLDIVDSSNWDNPLTWDNNGLADSGQYLAQEWDNQPLIDNLNKVGFGDDNFDPNFGNPIQVKYIDIMIYLRNNYRS